MPWSTRVSLIRARIASVLTAALAPAGIPVNSGLRLPGTEGLYDEASWLALHKRVAPAPAPLIGRIAGVDVAYVGSPEDVVAGLSTGLRLRTHE